MSVIIRTRGEAGGGVAAHLHCPHCGHWSKSHAQQLTHVAAAHPSCLDEVEVGRLGTIVTYQSSAHLFHCSVCFFTCKDFTKLYKHIISKHCLDDRGGKKMGEEGEEEALKRKRSSEEEAQDEDGAPLEAESQGSVLTYDGSIYRCLICGCENKLKVVSVNHVMKKHDIPKAYASQAIRRDVVTLRTPLSSTPGEEEAGGGMTGELLSEEMKATAKLLTFTSNRFVCLLCGWKTKLKGFAISHVARSHDVERPYGCTDCSASFFLPSRLQQHVRTAHRPGRYACPFCCFRSHYLGGFRRHCSRCNAREEGGAGGAAGGAGHVTEASDCAVPRVQCILGKAKRVTC
ncbi:chromosome alignment-maintaining phosphoprotein 1-like [Limanda limanda]|uniref:chromosome alignment-maintaining phosphoprotein 1-like n=1 Tax=Limanda limanda TaxID=27771 RepID=UPI0029C96BA6|nr:chromosome alignment-maintaining phosphoprotein 1-like [Limanda limanda]